MVIPFDLELAKEAIELELGNIITRNGSSVCITDWNSGHSDYPLVGYLNNNIFEPSSWNELGKWVVGKNHPKDLFLEIYNNIW